MTGQATGLHLAQPVFDWTSASLGDPWPLLEQSQDDQLSLNFHFGRVASRNIFVIPLLGFVCCVDILPFVFR